MTACGAVGALMVGGKVVGQLRCEADHERECPACRWGAGFGAAPVDEHVGHETHRVTLEWPDEGAPPDLDLFDPDERFDVDVTLGAAGPLCEVETCVRHAGHEGLHDDIVPD